MVSKNETVGLKRRHDEDVMKGERMMGAEVERVV
jgi:hypothetical protein